MCKYWHSPMFHAKAFACVISFGVFLYCCEVDINITCKGEQPVSNWEFREAFSDNMVK